jgi:predicted ATPase
VVFVDLSAVGDVGELARHVAGALGVREQPGTEHAAAVIAHLRDREQLLVLDNCEHLLDAAAQLAHDVLTGCGRVAILATSREVLDCPGEVDVPVPPLGVPEGEASPEMLRASDAITLFFARADEARHGLVDDDAAVRRAAEICRDLEGLPLAIELAAARARSLSLDEIAVHLRERFRFLVSWRRLTPARHRTLRQAIDWSFDLLSVPEQQLLARLSVFAGGATLAAIASVCLDGDDDEAIRLVDRLVASSLLNPIAASEQTRYRMLETVREYASERLAAGDDGDAVRHRHARYFRSLVEAAWAPIRLDDTATWTARLAAEAENLRAALAWARDSADAAGLLGLAEGLWYFWWVRGDVREGRAWLDQALQRTALDTPSGAVPPLLYARALGGAARLAWAATDFEAGIDLARRSYAALPDDAAPLDRGTALQTLGVISTARGDLAAARSLLEQAGTAFGSLPPDDPWRRDRLAGVHVVLGSVHFFEGDYAAATAEYREALADCVARGDFDGIALCELYIGHVDLIEGRVEEGLALVRSSLGRYHRLGWLQYVAECLELIAYGLWALGRTPAAARLYGAADAIRAKSNNAATLALAERRAEALPALAETLGAVAFDAELARGRTMDSKQVLAEALGA